MFVEIGLIQRISVFLGHPVYAARHRAVPASFSQRRWQSAFENSPWRADPFRHLVGMLAAYVLLPEWLPWLTHSSSLRQPSSARSREHRRHFPRWHADGICVFPTGMRLVTAIDPQPTPWLWGMNGAAGVLAAGLAVACGIGFSVDATIQVEGSAIFCFYGSPCCSGDATAAPWRSSRLVGVSRCQRLLYPGVG